MIQTVFPKKQSSIHNVCKRKHAKTKNTGGFYARCVFIRNHRQSVPSSRLRSRVPDVLPYLHDEASTHHLEVTKILRKSKNNFILLAASSMSRNRVRNVRYVRPATSCISCIRKIRTIALQIIPRQDGIANELEHCHLQSNYRKLHLISYADNAIILYFGRN